MVATYCLRRDGLIVERLKFPVGQCGRGGVCVEGRRCRREVAIDDVCQRPNDVVDLAFHCGALERCRAYDHQAAEDQGRDEQRGAVEQKVGLDGPPALTEAVKHCTGMSWT